MNFTIYYSKNVLFTCYLTMYMILVSEASSRNKGNNRANIRTETKKNEINTSRKIRHGKSKKEKANKKHHNSSQKSEKADTKNKDYIRRNIEVLNVNNLF